MLFNKQQLRALLVPLVIEQVLTGIMGVADTLMVSNVGGAAGDVTYAMRVSTLSMWIFRVALSWVLCRCTGLGLWGVWIGWCTDRLVRGLCFRFRFRSGKWLDHSVLDG